MNNNKVVIIGDGMVGSSIAFSLIDDDSVNELVIVDVNKSKAEGDILDMMHGLPFVSNKKLKAGDYKDISDAHIVVISAGVAQKENQTRIDLLKKNAAIISSIADDMKPYLNKDTIVLVVSNPVDILSYVVYKKLGIPSSKVIGSGTVLDTARLKSIIAEHVNVDPRNVHTYILGEHGDSEVAIYSLTTIGGIPINEYCNRCNKCDNCNLELDYLYQQVKNAAYEIISKKGATYYAVALAVRHIIKAIINNTHSILSVSTFIENEFNGKIKDIYFSLPCLINKDGIKRVLSINFNEDEKERLIKSANIIYNEIKSLDI